jgi:hypothetical protein
VTSNRRRENTYTTLAGGSLNPFQTGSNDGLMPALLAPQLLNNVDKSTVRMEMPPR